MATAKNPELVIDVVYRTNTAKMDEAARMGQLRLENQAAAATQKTEALVTRIKTTGEQKRQLDVEKIAAAGEARREQQRLAREESLQARLIAKDAMFRKQTELMAERSQARMLAGHTTWSQKMVKGIEGIATSLKGMILAYAGIKGLQFIKDAINFTGALGDQADALGITVQQLWAYKEAAANVDVTGEQLEKVLARLNMAITAPNDKQKAYFERLGLDAENLTTAQAFDAIVKSIGNGTTSIGELADVVSSRLALAFMKLSLAGKSTAELEKQFPFAFTDKQIEDVDKYTDAWARFFDSFKTGVAKSGYYLFMAQGPKPEYTFTGPGGYSSSPVPDWRKPKVAPEEQGPGLIGAERADVRAEMAEANAKAAKKEAEAYEKLQEAAKKAAKELENVLAVQIKSWEAQSSKGLASSAKGLSLPMGPVQGLPTPAMPSQMDMLKNSIESLGREWQKYEQVFGGVMNLTQAFFQLQAVETQNQIQRLELQMQKEQERWNDRSQFLQEAGLQNSALYRNERRAAESSQKAMQKQELGLKSKAWEQDKEARIVGTVMSTAQAIMNAFATAPFPLSIAIAALAAATGVVQEAAISEQENPYKGMAYGGWVRGNSGMDNVPIHATAGEFVSTASDASRNARSLEYMANGGTMSPGGGGGTTIIKIDTMIGSDHWVEQNLIPALKRGQRNGHNILRVA